MSPDSSQLLDPLRLANAGEHLSGTVNLDIMPRVKESLLTNKGELHFSLSFSIDEAMHCIIDVEIETRLLMRCQRCLEPTEVGIKRHSLIALVNQQSEVSELPIKYEPLVLDEQEITLLDLIEDELLLAMPLAPLHAENECIGTEKIERINADGRPNPFAVLESLKKN